MPARHLWLVPNFYLSFFSEEVCYNGTKDMDHLENFQSLVGQQAEAETECRDLREKVASQDVEIRELRMINSALVRVIAGLEIENPPAIVASYAKLLAKYEDMDLRYGGLVDTIATLQMAQHTAKSDFEDHIADLEDKIRTMEAKCASEIKARDQVIAVMRS